ncbi:MAG: NYN domain-containing protein [Pyrinomonadaceae bacterium]
MSYLIDGNNLMGQRPGWHHDRVASRRELMDELAVYAKSKRISLSVVFDGAPDEHFGDNSRYRGISIFYAERNSNADERIKNFVEESRERRTLVVVTSDKALADYVRRCGARVTPAGQFRREMENQIAQLDQSSQHKPERRLANEKELKGWMRYFEWMRAMIKCGFTFAATVLGLRSFAGVRPGRPVYLEA